MRVKSRWHNKEKARDAKQTGSTLAYIAWKTTLHSIQNMEDWGFKIGSPEHHFQLAYEFAAFLIQATDRYAHERMEDDERAALIGAVAQRVIAMIEENQLEIMGPGDYRQAIIERFNKRFADYADLTYTEEGPGYSALRYFAERVVAGLPEENRAWVMEQIIEVEAPNTIENLFKGLRDQLPDPRS